MLAVAPDGVIWFGTLDSRVFRFDDQGWMNYTPADGLPDSYVPDLAVATDGALWFWDGRRRLALPPGGWRTLDGPTLAAFPSPEGKQHIDLALRPEQHRPPLEPLE